MLHSSFLSILSIHESSILSASAFPPLLARVKFRWCDDAAMNNLLELTNLSTEWGRMCVHGT